MPAVLFLEVSKSGVLPVYFRNLVRSTYEYLGCFGRKDGDPTSTLTKEVGDISSVFPSLSGKKAAPLPPRFAELKRLLIRGNEDAIEASWTRLLSDLRREVEKIKSEGSSIIPSVSYSHVENGSVPPSFVNSIRHRGVGVIRDVIDKKIARDLKYKTDEYIAANKSKVKAFPPDSPAVYELYWSPAQTFARAHPNVLRTQAFLSGSLWHSSDPTSKISTTYPLTYADRLRIRQPGDAQFALGPHIDGGSIERWEDPEYRSCYRAILNGNWESYDPFDARHRIHAQMNMYNGAGGCSMFRLFQGWLAMSSTSPGEGTLRVCPLLRHATAYLILRPFFDPQTNRLDLTTSDFPGSIPAACQEYNPTTHPHLQLLDTMVSVPHVEPGDYVAWHCDSIHAVDAQHCGKSDSSVLYIPACAMTEQNIEFLKRQRESAASYSPPPDFPGAGGEGERHYSGRVDWNDGKFLGVEGRRAMGLSGKWQVLDHMSSGERSAVEMGNHVLFGM